MTDGVGRKWDKSTNWPGSIVLKAPLGLLFQYKEFRNRTFWKRPRLSDNGEYVRRKVITHARKKMIQLGAFYSRIYRIFAAFLCFFPRKRGAQRQGQLKACWSASHTVSKKSSAKKTSGRIDAKTNLFGCGLSCEPRSESKSRMQKEQEAQQKRQRSLSSLLCIKLSVYEFQFTKWERQHTRELERWRRLPFEFDFLLPPSSSSLLLPPYFTLGDGYSQ